MFLVCYIKHTSKKKKSDYIKLFIILGLENSYQKYSNISNIVKYY